MSAIKNNIFHKDCSPEVTVHKIRNILSDIGLSTYEISWTNILDKIYSVSISDNLGFGANGKGVSLDYALASAYAEFMERLQNNVLYPSSFGLMNEIKVERDDAIDKKIEELILEHQDIFEILFPLRLDELNKESKTSCVLYYNAFEKKTEYLPEALVKSFCGSTGMAAGNSGHEAIIQGISEIFERYVIKDIFLNKHDVPTIPIDILKDDYMLSFLSNIKSLGYSIVIKDCSLNNTFPVVGVIILNRDKTKTWMCFGSDPIFEIAIQRCVTEIFQGVNNRDFEKYKMVQVDFTNINYEPLPDLHTKIESPSFLRDYTHFQISQIVNKLLVSQNYTFKTPSIFESCFRDNKTSFSKYLDIIKGNQLKLYIRDVSFLGFPSYHIYIPGLSEMYTEDDFFNNEIISSKLKKVFLRLKKSSFDEIKQCVEIIENVGLKTAHFKFQYSLKPDKQFVKNFSKILLKKDSDFFNLSLEFIMACMFLKIRDFEKAFEYLNIHINNTIHYGIAPDNLEYYKCVSFFLKLKSTNKTDNDIINSLVVIFGMELTSEVYNDLKDPDDVFKYMELPLCGDCEVCDVKGVCYYNDWSIFVQTLNERHRKNKISQDELRLLFA